MNREIWFRGKRIDNGEWVVGSLVKMGPAGYFHYFILPDYASVFCDIEVDPGTIGQYIGLTDKIGVKIFEGDIVSIPGSKKMGLPAEVYYFSINGSFGLRRHGYSRICLENSDEWALVVGNIHDNPEILGGNDGTPD